MKIINKTSLLLLLTPLLLFSIVVFAKPTHAAAVTGFNAGNIMDDAIFTKKSSMSAAQIQTFLNSKVPTCDTWGTKPSEYGGGTRAQYGTSQGYPPPYKCLKSYSQGGKTAAKIIYDTAQEFSINPQVLIVLLQKEQGLVTDTWPWSIQYKSATGYGCPDTAACDSQYYGFTNQVRWAARMFRAILNQSPTWYTPYELGNNRIYWHPDTARCGSSTVNIQNLTTVALYSYTPYRPNQAALNAGYGTGNSCSSYGNRNFYQYFKDWFGSPHAPSYQAKIIEHSSYPTIKQGESAPVYVKFKNTGSANWYDDYSAAGANQKPVRIATDIPLNRKSALGDLWPANHRPGIGFDRVYNADGSLSTDQTVVKPGQMAEFWFAYYAHHGSKTGTFTEGFRPIVEGLGPMNNTGTYFKVTVIKASYTAEHAGQSSAPNLRRGQSASTYMRFRNTGNVTWHDATSAPGSGQLPIHLSTDSPLNRVSAFSSSWPYSHRPAVNFGAVYESNGTTLASNQHLAQPGQIVRFNFNVTVPSNKSTGFYQESLRPIVQGLGPMNNTGTWLGINVTD